jgi:hypothetical protein
MKIFFTVHFNLFFVQNFSSNEKKINQITNDLKLENYSIKYIKYFFTVHLNFYDFSSDIIKFCNAKKHFKKLIFF